MTQPRSGDRAVENENQKPDGDGKPPRPATEPAGGKVPPPEETETDPATGEPS